MKLSVLIPVYNEENNLEKLFERLFEFLKIPLFSGVEFVAINDSSTDNSPKILNKYADSGKIILLNHLKTMGKGAAIRSALSVSTGDYVVIQDADLEYDPQDIVKMAKVVFESGAEIVYGSRFLGKAADSFDALRFINAGLTTLSNFFTGLRLTDMETCYKMVKSEVIKNIVIKENGFGFEPEITAKLSKIAKEKGYKIVEIPISYDPRDYKAGKKIKIRDGFRTIWAIFKYALTNFQ